MVSASYLQPPQARRNLIGLLSHHVMWHRSIGLSLAQDPPFGPLNEGPLVTGPQQSIMVWCGFHNGISCYYSKLTSTGERNNHRYHQILPMIRKNCHVVIIQKSLEAYFRFFQYGICLQLSLHFMFTNTVLQYYPYLMAEEPEAQKGSTHLKSHNYQMTDSRVRPRCLVFSFRSISFHPSAFV